MCMTDNVYMHKSLATLKWLLKHYDILEDRYFDQYTIAKYWDFAVLQCVTK